MKSIIFLFLLIITKVSLGSDCRNGFELESKDDSIYNQIENYFFNKKQYLSFEIGGAGLLYSIKFNRIIKLGEDMDAEWKSGGTFWWTEKGRTNETMMFFSGIDFVFLSNLKVNPLIGGGAGIFFDPFPKSHKNPSGNYSFKLYNSWSAFFSTGVKMNLSHRLNLSIEYYLISLAEDVYHWGGISVGYKF